MNAMSMNSAKPSANSQATPNTAIKLTCSHRALIFRLATHMANKNTSVGSTKNSKTCGMATQACVASGQCWKARQVVEADKATRLAWSRFVRRREVQ